MTTFTMRYRSAAEREVIRRVAEGQGITVAELFRRSLERQGVFLPDRPIAVQQPPRRRSKGQL